MPPDIGEDSQSNLGENQSQILSPHFLCPRGVAGWLGALLKAKEYTLLRRSRVASFRDLRAKGCGSATRTDPECRRVP